MIWMEDFALCKIQEKCASVTCNRDSMFFQKAIASLRQFRCVCNSTITTRSVSYRRSKSSYPRRCHTQWCALIIMTDCVRQTISLSPISLSKIFVAPTRSARALVSKIPMRIYTFRIFLEQRTVIRFLPLKRLCAPRLLPKLSQSVRQRCLSFLR
jgi:hypothetical protein